MSNIPTMQQIVSSTATGYTFEWKHCPDSEISETFKVFNAPDRGNSHYPDQFSRILGIDYGLIDETLRNGVLKMPEGGSLNMHLAIYQSKFVFLFELPGETPNDSTFYGPSQLDGGRIYEIKNAEVRKQNTAFFGISRELRDQLAYNWLVSPYSVTDLFYSLAKPENQEESPQPKQPVIAVKTEGQQCFVRAHYYKIAGENLSNLQAVIKQPCAIRIRFGVNCGDKFLDKDLFAPILEIIPISQSELLENEAIFLDFVHACPPHCPK